MAWTSPRNWTDGDTLTETLFKNELQKNLQYLHGEDGSIEYQDNITFPSTQTVDGVDLSAHNTGTAKSQHTGGVDTHNHESSGSEGGQLDYQAFSGRLTESQMPSAASGILRANGAGVDPDFR